MILFIHFTSRKERFNDLLPVCLINSAMIASAIQSLPHALKAFYAHEAYRFCPPIAAKPPRIILHRQHRDQISGVIVVNNVRITCYIFIIADTGAGKSIAKYMIPGGQGLCI